MESLLIDYYEKSPAAGLCDEFLCCDVTQESKVLIDALHHVEVIDDHGEFKVLEIDARLPSQTPTVVYHTTGVNFVEELMELFCHGGGPLSTGPIPKRSLR